MKTFNKSTKLDNVCYDIRGPVMDEAVRMESEGQRILKLNIGCIGCRNYGVNTRVFFS